MAVRTVWRMGLLLTQIRSMATSLLNTLSPIKMGALNRNGGTKNVVHDLKLCEIFPDVIVDWKWILSSSSFERGIEIYC